MGKYIYDCSQTQNKEKQYDRKYIFLLSFN